MNFGTVKVQQCPYCLLGSILMMSGWSKLVRLATSFHCLEIVSRSSNDWK